MILGGTVVADNYSTLPDLETSGRILKEAFEMCPELSQTGDWRGIEVVSHNVGLRPARKGGMRLELERRKLGERKGELIPGPGRGEREGKEVGVVHAYGIGSAR